MQDILGMITQLSRPKLLVRAARFGIDDYRRSTQLPRILGCATAPRTGPAVMQLLALEVEQDTKRQAQNAEYSIARHIDLLVALMAEAQLLRASTEGLRAVT